ncbi:fibrillarin-like nucleolar protein [Hamiltosporidium magnivora]|uniref:Fibrillarin-like nucleolar protein n=2 Tax=Hamiltosporidium TaxID=1176354 RepID=A0A4V2JWD3_9MICR|nr:fibrillarin-like nucleolar protein [Hamiltosporidium magnivora]
MDLILFENSMGFALIKINEDSNLFLHSFYPLSPAQSLENQHLLSQGQVSSELLSFLSLHKVKSLICDKSLHSALSKEKISVKSNNDIMRNIRLNQIKLLKEKQTDINQSILSLSHKYSRDKIEYDTKKEDNFVIQSYLVLEELDKDISKYIIRLKELTSNFFPELSNICDNNNDYCKILNIFIEFYINKEEELKSSSVNLNELNFNKKSIYYEELKNELLKNIKDNLFVENILNSYMISVGSVLFIYDLKNISRINKIIIEKQKTAENLNNYLIEKLTQIAPNLLALLGNKLSAKLIATAGSLLNLAKCPSSTLQVLGAEKALFRALKAKSSTPKYGFIYQAPGVSQVNSDDKGKLCRFIASKCSIASRIDYFSEEKTNEYGKSLLKMVEDRVKNIKGGIRVENTDIVLKRVFDKIKNEKINSKKNSKKLKYKEDKEKSKLKKSKEDEKSKEEKKNKKSKEDIVINESKRSKENKESKENKKSEEDIVNKESKKSKEDRGNKENKKIKESKKIKENKKSKEDRGNKENKKIKEDEKIEENKKSKENRESKKIKKDREITDKKDKKNSLFLENSNLLFNKEGSNLNNEILFDPMERKTKGVEKGKSNKKKIDDKKVEGDIKTDETVETSKSITKKGGKKEKTNASNTVKKEKKELKQNLVEEKKEDENKESKKKSNETTKTSKKAKSTDENKDSKKAKSSSKKEVNELNTKTEEETKNVKSKPVKETKKKSNEPTKEPKNVKSTTTEKKNKKEGPVIEKVTLEVAEVVSVPVKKVDPTKKEAKKAGEHKNEKAKSESKKTASTGKEKKKVSDDNKNKVIDSSKSKKEVKKTKK